MVEGDKYTTNRTRHLDKFPYQSWQSSACTEFIEVSIWAIDRPRRVVPAQDCHPGHRSGAESSLSKQSQNVGEASVLHNIKNAKQTQNLSRRSATKTDAKQTQFYLCASLRKESQRLPAPKALSGASPQKLYQGWQKYKTNPIFFIFNPKTKNAEKTKPIQTQKIERSEIRCRRTNPRLSFPRRRESRISFLQNKANYPHFQPKNKDCRKNKPKSKPKIERSEILHSLGEGGQSQIFRSGRLPLDSELFYSNIVLK
jgi:hypothetical protein